MMPFGPPPTPEEAAKFTAYVEAARASEIAERRVMRQWAAVFCACRPWYARGEPPPQVGCPLHSSVVLLENGRWL